MAADGSDLKNLTGPTGDGGHRPQWTSDGRIMFIGGWCDSAPCSEICEMDPDGDNVERLTHGFHDWGVDGFPDAMIKISLEPRGSRVLVTTMTGPPVAGYDLRYEVWLLDLDTMKRRLIFHDLISEFS